MSAAQCSRYKKEIDQIVEECEIGKDKVQRLSEMKAKRLVVRKVVQLVRGGLNDTLDTQKAHSLRGLPQYPVGAGLQKYLTIKGDYKTLAKFRLGDAGLGNRRSPKIEVCPLCHVGQNSESHLVFSCSSVQELRLLMDQSVQFKEFLGRTAMCKDNDDRLRLFLGGDLPDEDQLAKRSTFLSILKDKHNEGLEALAQLEPKET